MFSIKAMKWGYTAGPLKENSPFNAFNLVNRD